MLQHLLREKENNLRCTVCILKEKTIFRNIIDASIRKHEFPNLVVIVFSLIQTFLCCGLVLPVSLFINGKYCLWFPVKSLMVQLS